MTKNIYLNGLIRAVKWFGVGLFASCYFNATLSGLINSLSGWFYNNGTPSGLLAVLMMSLFASTFMLMCKHVTFREFSSQSICAALF